VAAKRFIVLDKVADQVKRSVAAGSRVLMGGGRVNRTGAFMQPSILTDIKRALPLMLKTGMVFVNHPTWTSPELPSGGIKNSGYGRELSGLGIQEFVNKKLVCVVPINAPAKTSENRSFPCHPK